MDLRTRLQDPRLRLRLGAAALLLASLCRWFVQPPVAWQQSWTDGIMGLLYGLAIAFLLLSLRSTEADRCTPAVPRGKG